MTGGSCCVCKMSRRDVKLHSFPADKEVSLEFSPNHSLKLLEITRNIFNYVTLSENQRS